MTFSQADAGSAAVAADARSAAAVTSRAWQERALTRSLGDTRARTVERLTRFVDAARALATESGSASFTVQQVCERSGQSLKSFYRVFEGKDDLLLALLEDDAAVGAALLAGSLGERPDHESRVRAFIVGLFRLMAAGDAGYVGVLIREERRLAEVHPDQLDAALAPFIDLLAAELDAAMDAGVVRRGDPRRAASMVFDLVLLRIHDAVIGRTALSPDEIAAELWSFCWAGLAGEVP